jgi:outer membrane protein assembly factor BamB
MPTATISASASAIHFPEPTHTAAASPIAASTTTPSATAQPAFNLPELALYRNDVERSGRYEVVAMRAQPDVLWEREVGASSAPLSVGDTLLVGTASGRLLLLDAARGDERLSISLGASIIAAPAVADGRIFVGTDNDGLFALDADGGGELWHAPADGIIWGAPLVAERTVFFGADSGFHALDAASGAERFTLTTDGGRVYSPAAFHDGTLYAAFGVRLVAADAATGEIYWEHSVELDWNRLAVDADAIYCGAEDGRFHALDRMTGDERWRSAQAGNFWSAPALTGELIIVGNVDSRIRALDRASGSQVWEFAAEDWATADPMVAGDTVYIGVGNHEGRPGERPLYALDLTTGEVLWTFKTDGLIHAAVAVDAAGLYVVTTNGTLYALG